MRRRSAAAAAHRVSPRVRHKSLRRPTQRCIRRAKRASSAAAPAAALSAWL